MPKIDRPGWPIGKPVTPPEFRSVEALSAHLEECPPDVLRGWVAAHAVHAFPPISRHADALHSLAERFKLSADIASSTSTVRPDLVARGQLPRFLRRGL